ncbi:MAG: phosphatidate cytidylyltransferase [Solirubrobacteraceae bacterium]
MARVAVAIPAIIFAVVIVASGGLVFALGVGALGIVCMAELYGLLDRAHPVRLAGFITMIALVLAAQYGNQFQVFLVAVAAVPLLFGLVLLGPRRRGATASMAATLLGIYWIGFAIAHAVLLRNLLHGDAIIVDVLVGTFLGDTGAYFGGRMFGRRPLAPEISPNKTVEGMLIGMVVAVAAVWFAGLYQDWLSGADALILGLGVALVAPLGDLFESLIKRDMETKDTGRLFGAHGGALDRLDAALFTIPVGYYIWVALM